MIWYTIWYMMIWVSLDFFIDIILPAALWPWGWLSLLQKWVPWSFPGGKGGRCVGLTTLPPSCVDCVEICEPQPPGTLRACPGLQWDIIKNMMIWCDIWYMICFTPKTKSPVLPTRYQHSGADTQYNTNNQQIRVLLVLL